MQKKIALICNPTPEGGKALRVADMIQVLLSVKKIEHTLFAMAWPDDWDCFTHIWIVGGDGTLHYFINQYPTTELPLSIFRAGSGNDFHWMMYGDMTLEQQVEKVLNDKVLWVDAGIRTKDQLQ
jgi:diacylglycerol kinase family enzyme